MAATHGLDQGLLALAREVLDEVREEWAKRDNLTAVNQERVLRSFIETGVSSTHFAPTSGYGYGDRGRDTLERLFAQVFFAEAALVRWQLVSGTHALATALYGLLRPGDELLSVTGTPYDTLGEVIGHPSAAGEKSGQTGSLADFGISFRQISPLPDGSLDEVALRANLTERTKVVLIQRSRGYAWGPSRDLSQIEVYVKKIKTLRPEVVCLVDNCYGEFVEAAEPCQVGADLAVGSLIKNPGGGLAPTGGYIVGKKELVEAAAARLYAPGLGSHIGPSLGDNRLFFQGLYLAPHFVGEAVKGAIFVARFFERLGFAVSPRWNEARTDLIQAVRLESRQRLIAFCRAVQGASPVDSYVRPEPWAMPGYPDEVIMAAGTFVQGASLELSADGPLRPPYIAYLQGGLVKEQVILAALLAAKELAPLEDQ